MPTSVPLATSKNETRDYHKAKILRQSASFAERLLWNALRQIPKEMGLRFRRQHPLHPYIADFVCLKVKLVLELDGESHDVRQDYDRERDENLRQMGYKILRFTNEDVLQNCEGVVQTVLNIVDELALLHPSPSPSRKGRGTPAVLVLEFSSLSGDGL